MSIEIPNYSLLKKIGVGAFAEVWLAEHKHNRRKAAIKILKGTMEPGGDEEQLFLREGEVLASFDQPNIVRIFDNARVGDSAYLVMEYLAGGSLADRMSQQGIAVGEAIGHVVQIAAALDAAHARDIIHRDLKPANIMLRNETTPVLTDFGASRLVKRSTIHGKGGGVIGTPQYMSPEQIRGDPLDGRSDLYALGILFHELLSGKVPFDGTVTETVVQHLQAPPPRLPAELRVLQPVVDKLLAKDRDDRYPNGAALCNALRQTFLDQDALRRLVQFTPASAWSSQLLALGFQLDTQRRNEVRIAQGQALADAASGLLDDGFRTRAAPLPQIPQPPPMAAPAARVPIAAPPLAPPPLPPRPAHALAPAVAPVVPNPAPPVFPQHPGASAQPPAPPASKTLRGLGWAMLALLIMFSGAGEERDPQTLVGAAVLLFSGQIAFQWMVARESRRHGRIVLLLVSLLAQLPAAAAVIATGLLTLETVQLALPTYLAAFTMVFGVAILASALVGVWVLIVSRPREGWIAAGVLIGLMVAASQDQQWANVAGGLVMCALWGMVGWWGDLRVRGKVAG